MKTLKTLSVAVIAAASLAFCATSAKAYPSAGITTNYDTVTLSATLMTNGYAETKQGTNEESTFVMKSVKFVNKDLLNLLTNSDFAGFPFPTGSKLVLGWDGNWNGDVLVVDKSGTNVIYDATANYGNSNIATVVINPYAQTGALNPKETGNGGSLTWYNNGSFLLKDDYVDMVITGTGPCTEHFSIAYSPKGNSTWTDSQKFGVNGASEPSEISPYLGTLSGNITLSGKGKGEPDYILETYLDHFGL